MELTLPYNSWGLCYYTQLIGEGKGPLTLLAVSAFILRWIPNPTFPMAEEGMVSQVNLYTVSCSRVTSKGQRHHAGVG